MADDKAARPSFLMMLPLEVRHTIFEYAAARDVKPKKLLRYWFEKQELKALIAAQAASGPNGQTPRVVHSNDDYDEDSEVDEETSQEQDQDSEAEDDAEVADEQEDGEENEEDADMDNEEEAEDVDNGEEVEDMDQAADEEEDGVETQETQETQDSGEEDADEAMTEQDTGGDATATATPAQSLPPAPVVRAHRKWRYIPNFMRLTHCPPPVELLLTSKQLSDEAKDWYYDVAVLRIEATGSFAHTSFYEEALSQITEAAFSPMENIRKVQVTFVWDTTWIRADTTGYVDAIFPAMLRQRSNFVFQILSQAPDLREVTIHWHDSAQDNESANLMIDVLAPFHTLPAMVKLQEHYIAADAKPHKKSTAGKRRVEFQNILDMGLDRLF